VCTYHDGKCVEQQTAVNARHLYVQVHNIVLSLCKYGGGARYAPHTSDNVFTKLILHVRLAISGRQLVRVLSALWLPAVRAASVQRSAALDVHQTNLGAGQQSADRLQLAARSALRPVVAGKPLLDLPFPGRVGGQPFLDVLHVVHHAQHLLRRSFQVAKKLPKSLNDNKTLLFYRARLYAPYPLCHIINFMRCDRCCDFIMCRLFYNVLCYLIGCWQYRIRARLRNENIRILRTTSCFFPPQ